MEPYHLWREEYRREVDQTLGEMRSAKAKGEPVPAAPLVMDFADAIVPPAGIYQDLSAARAELGEAKGQLEALRAKLEQKGQHLEEELRRRSRIKDLVVNLNTHIGALEREAAEARHTAQDSVTKSKRYYDAAALAEARLQEAMRRLEEEQQHTKQALARASALQGSVDELQLQLDTKERAFKTLLARYDVSEQDFLSRIQSAQVRVGELEKSNDELRRRAASVEALEAGHQRALQEASAAAEGKLERLEALHREGEAQAEAERKALQSVIAALNNEKLHLEVQFKDALQENDGLRQRANEVRRQAISLEDETTERALADARALHADKMRLQSETAEAMQKAAALQAQGEERLAEVRRREAAAEKALLDSQQVKAAADAVAQALRREKEGLQAELERERALLQQEYEAKRSQIHADVQTEMESLRARIKALLSSQASTESERERLRVEHERARRRILEETRHELERPRPSLASGEGLAPLPGMENASPAGTTAPGPSPSTTAGSGFGGDIPEQQLPGDPSP